MNPCRFLGGAVAILLAASANAQITYLSAGLEGAQEVPATTSTARGFGIVRLDQATGNVRIFLHQEGIAAPTAAHLHQAPAGSNGGIIVPLAGGPADYTGTATLTAAQAAAVLADGTYLNVHSGAFPGGEIRGMVTTAKSTRLTALLSGANEVPPTGSSGTGQAVAFLHEPDNRIVYVVNQTGLVGITAAHFHQGAAGVNGPVIVPLTNAPNYVGVSAPLTAAQVTAFKTGGMYVNIHTGAFPGGEIRGQMQVSDSDVAVMSGANEVPPNNSPAAGGGCLILQPNGIAVVTVSFAGLTSSDTAVHVHSGVAGVNGPVIAPLSFSSPGHYQGAFVPTPAQLTALRSGGLYVNVHTINFPGGEIRGQLTAAELPATFGISCLGSNQVRSEIGATGFPCLGATMSIDLYGAAPGNLSLLGLGANRDNLGPLPLPAAFTLAGVAAPNCYFFVDPVSTATTFTDARGFASQILGIPLTPSLRGGLFYAQYYVFDAGANAAGVIGSNALTLPVQ